MIQRVISGIAATLDTKIHSSTTRPRRRRFATVLAVIALIWMGAATTQAAILTVPGSSSTIQGAINLASPGDTINVAAGTYNESPWIKTSVTLHGASGATIVLQSNSPPTYLGALEISASNVTVDGFTIQGFDAIPCPPASLPNCFVATINNGLASSNILVDTAVNNIKITNNTLQVGNIDSQSNGDDGIGLLTTYNPGDTVTLTVTGNTFRPLNSGAFRGFYINPGVSSFNFSQNAISGNFSRRSITQANNSIVQGNTVTGAGAPGSRSAGIGVWGYPDPTTYGHATLSGNYITGTSIAISIIEANSVTANCNRIEQNDTGIVVDTFTSLPFNPATSAINQNSIAGNTNGIQNLVSAGPLDGSGNWWGCPAGANGGPGCDTVSSWVQVVPVLTAAPTCVGCTGAPNGAACNDNHACTASDHCDGSGSCVGTAVVCPAADQCHIASTCQEPSGQCPSPAKKPNGTPCNDANACTVSDKCLGGQCIGISSQHENSCDDHNPCTDDSCDPATPGGCVHINNTASCTDGNACTTNDTCSGGSCVAGALANCDDANPCTNDFCSAPSGCAHTNITDGTQCTSATGVAGACAAGSCCTPALGGLTGGIPSGLLDAIEQQCPSCPRNGTTHVKYVKCVKSMAKVMRSNQVITTKQQKAINKAAQQASVGR